MGGKVGQGKPSSFIGGGTKSDSIENARYGGSRPGSAQANVLGARLMNAPESEDNRQS